jgi:hypothetical protein
MSVPNSKKVALSDQCMPASGNFRSNGYIAPTRSTRRYRDGETYNGRLVSPQSHTFVTDLWFYQASAIWQLPPEKVTRENISLQRDWFRFLVEKCELDLTEVEVSGYMDDTADHASLHAFVYGSTEESTAAFFWLKLTKEYKSGYRPFFNLDVVALDDDTTYLLKYGNSYDAVKLRVLALAYVRIATPGPDHSASNKRRLGQLMAGVMDLGLDLHGSSDGISPLLSLLHIIARERSARNMEARLDAWLTLLKSVGVDLRLYGQEEWNRFQALRRDCERPWWRGVDVHQWEDYPSAAWGEFSIWYLECRYAPTLTAFTYGEEVSDWKLWLLHPGDQHAGQFWRMIEQNGIFDRHVPGGWVEDELL